jgi:antitoxin HicB
MRKAAEALEFAAEDWSEQTGSEFPRPRTIDELRGNAEFQDNATDAMIAAVPCDGGGGGIIRPHRLSDG